MRRWWLVDLIITTVQKIQLKERITVFQNLKPSIPSNSYRDQGRSYSGEDTAQFRVDILSNINVIAKRDLLTLDISLHMERGKTG